MQAIRQRTLILLHKNVHNKNGKYKHALNSDSNNVTDTTYLHYQLFYTANT